MFGALIQIIKKNKLMPKISDTEKAALEAGTVWVEGELFSGRPNFEKILAESYPSLTDEEKAFLDGPCEEVCNMASAWDINETIIYDRCCSRKPTTKRLTRRRSRQWRIRCPVYAID